MKWHLTDPFHSAHHHLTLANLVAAFEWHVLFFQVLHSGEVQETPVLCEEDGGSASDTAGHFSTCNFFTSACASFSWADPVEADCAAKKGLEEENEKLQLALKAIKPLRKL